MKKDKKEPAVGPESLQETIDSLTSGKEAISPDVGIQYGHRLYELKLLVGYLRSDERDRYQAFVEALREIKRITSKKNGDYEAALSQIETKLRATHGLPGPKGKDQRTYVHRP